MEANANAEALTRKPPLSAKTRQRKKSQDTKVKETTLPAIGRTNSDLNTGNSIDNRLSQVKLNVGISTGKAR